MPEQCFSSYTWHSLYAGSSVSPAACFKLGQKLHVRVAVEMFRPRQSQLTCAVAILFHVQGMLVKLYFLTSPLVNGLCEAVCPIGFSAAFVFPSSCETGFPAVVAARDHRNSQPLMCGLALECWALLKFDMGSLHWHRIPGVPSVADPACARPDPASPLPYGMCYLKSEPLGCQVGQPSFGLGLTGVLTTC